MSPSLVALLVLGTSNFPSAVARLAGGPTPSCSLCHQGMTGRGTVTTPFGKAMRGQGLMPGDEASLRTAFAALSSAGTDSDADGVADVAELAAGQNPNASSHSGELQLEPSYGCSAAGVGPGALMLLALRRWRRAPDRR